MKGNFKFVNTITYPRLIPFRLHTLSRESQKGVPSLPPAGYRAQAAPEVSEFISEGNSEEAAGLISEYSGYTSLQTFKRRRGIAHVQENITASFCRQCDSRVD
jgi:hypothetical protein